MSKTNNEIKELKAQIDQVQARVARLRAAGERGSIYHQAYDELCALQIKYTYKKDGLVR